MSVRCVRFLVFWGRKNRRNFADEIFKHIFSKENAWISIDISLKYITNGSIDNISALVQILTWLRTGGKPLSEPVVA